LSERALRDPCNTGEIGYRERSVCSVIAGAPAYLVIGQVRRRPHSGAGTGSIRVGVPEPEDMVYSYNVNMTSKCRPMA
jgi:hypothetical protein